MKSFHAFTLALTAAATLTISSSAEDSCCRAAATPAAAAALPDESLYHLAATWQDQDGKSVTLADFAGAPVVITMMFTHCAYACPRIVADLKNLRAALPAGVRDQARFVLASFDTARDTPARLHAWAASQELGDGWTLLHGDTAAVRELSVLLDIPFVPQPDGSFGHGNRLVLLDAGGVAVAAVEGLGAQPGPIVSAVTALGPHP
jgi:protein SCO1/2